MAIENKKGIAFSNIIAIIGAILIFVGIAWLIAWNWSKIPNFVKITILLVATLASYFLGVIAKEKNYSAAGRALIALGGLLYILSVFLVSQMYNLGTSMQHYSWLIFLAWTVVAITAYFLGSMENLLTSLIAFFFWTVFQYISLDQLFGNEESMIFGIAVLFLAAGILLYGLSLFHKSINHKFYMLYRFWTAFYLLAIFCLFSFQALLPFLGSYAFDASIFNAFTIIFVLVCLFVFILSALFSVSKNSENSKNIYAFLAVIAVFFVLMLSTKFVASTVGSCYPKSCGEFRTSADCNSAPSKMVCEWRTDQWNTQGYCSDVGCYDFNTQAECAAANPNLKCVWQNNYCGSDLSKEGYPAAYEECQQFNNQRSECSLNDACNWQPSVYGVFGGSSGKQLPLSFWMLWIIINFAFIGFILLVIAYGQSVNSTKIVNLALAFFVLEIFSRYIGFMMDLQGYLGFSILSIIGGILLIGLSLIIPRWRRRILAGSKK